jgi:hypothetical protein
LCGVSLGRDVATVKDQYNTKGYFENEVLLKIHAQALRQFKISFFGQGTPPQINSTELSKTLTATFREQFDGSEKFAIKDMRILLMKPSYLRALEDYGADVKVLALRRRRESVEASIAAGPWNAKDRASATYERYSALLDGFGVEPVLNVQFENLIEDPKATMQKVCDFIGAKYNPEVESFVDKGMVHQ